MGLGTSKLNAQSVGRAPLCRREFDVSKRRPQNCEKVAAGNNQKIVNIQWSTFRKHVMWSPSKFYQRHTEKYFKGIVSIDSG